MDGTVMIKTVIKHYLIGMGSAFNVFPKSRMRNLPFKVSIGDSFASDKVALCNDMMKIGKYFPIATKKVNE